MIIMMMIYKSIENFMIEDAPAGLLLLDNGSIICKSEYKNTTGLPECIIVDSGEYYCGPVDAACRSLIIKER